MWARVIAAAIKAGARVYNWIVRNAARVRRWIADALAVDAIIQRVKDILGIK